jgi:sugar/nucleoside kinase (ribokinase family)
LTSQHPGKILGVGSPMVDILVRVPDGFLHREQVAKGGSCLVGPGELDRILAATGEAGARVPGGSAANTIFGLAELGYPTTFLGKLGDDETGEFYRCRYVAMGGDDTRLKVHPEMPTGRCLGLITPDSERTMRTDLGAAATLDPEELVPADFANCRHVHLEGYLLFNELLVRRVLHLACEAGATVSLDLASFEVVHAASRILPELLRDHVDIVFANEDEAAAFPGGGAPAEALGVLAGLCPVAAVKLGPEGSLIRRGDETVRIPALKANAVDTTGAGDLWAAGFLAGFFADLPLDACGRLGSLAGAEVVQVVGAAIPEARWHHLRHQFCELRNCRIT